MAEEVRYLDGPFAGGCVYHPEPIPVGAHIMQPILFEKFLPGTGNVQLPLGPRGSIVCDYRVVPDGARFTGELRWEPPKEWTDG